MSTTQSMLGRIYLGFFQCPLWGKLVFLSPISNYFKMVFGNGPALHFNIFGWYWYHNIILTALFYSISRKQTLRNSQDWRISIHNKFMKQYQLNNKFQLIRAKFTNSFHSKQSPTETLPPIGLKKSRDNKPFSDWTAARPVQAKHWASPQMKGIRDTERNFQKGLGLKSPLGTYS